MSKREEHTSEYYKKMYELYLGEVEKLQRKLEENEKERINEIEKLERQHSEELNRLYHSHKSELAKKDEEIYRILRDNDEANRAREIWEELGKIGHRVEELLKLVNEEFPGKLPIGI